MSKSSDIQWRYRELSIDNTILNNFAMEDSLYDTACQSDALLDLIQALNDRIKDIVDTLLTVRQKEVVTLIFYQGYSQTEVATMTSTVQPTIHKILFGNLDYKHGGKRYGGAIKKMKRLCEKDEQVCSLLAQIDQLKQELR